MPHPDDNKTNDQNQNQDNQPAGKVDVKPSVDMDLLKEELKNQNAQLLNTILENISNKKENVDNEEISYDKALEEFQDELKEIRVDEEQAKGMIKLFKKLMAKENPKLKDEIKGEVQSQAKFEKDKEAKDAEMASMFPAILNKKSELFKRASIEYEKLSDSVKNSSDGTSVAILKAAAALGITPIDVRTIRQMNAMGPNGGNPPREDDKITQKAIDFAASFGVKKDKFEEKLRAIKAKSM